MIREASLIIKASGVIVYPTETVYGIGANALNEQAVYRVFQIKKRHLSMPIFLAVSSMRMLQKVAEVNKKDLALLEKILPGPISVLVKKTRIVPDILTAGSPIIGVRFPENEMALKIIDLSGPITSTSANMTGHPPPVSAEEVSEEIREKVDLVVDGGRSKYRQPSTLLDLSNRKIMRQGAALERVLKAIS
ncbi:MAG: L-threonylcarbamoyladenylate synthase [Methanotrichaceae archaeon]|nr:L-threonylcarbamoyladenylate synthase [Methanotrichaceae archaeon]